MNDTIKNKVATVNSSITIRTDIQTYISNQTENIVLTVPFAESGQTWTIANAGKAGTTVSINAPFLMSGMLILQREESALIESAGGFYIIK
jgi:hypothetical protein